jgi:hypothetical protein
VIASFQVIDTRGLSKPEQVQAGSFEYDHISKVVTLRALGHATTMQVTVIDRIIPYRRMFGSVILPLKNQSGGTTDTPATGVFTK